MAAAVAEASAEQPTISSRPIPAITVDGLIEAQDPAMPDDSSARLYPAGAGIVTTH